MKKNLLRSVALSALLLVGIGAPKAQAQTSYEVPPLNPEYQTMADQIIELNLDDPEGANKVFSKLIKKISKSKEDLVSVGTYFLQNNNYPAANQCATKLYDLSTEYIPGLMFMGEVCMKRKDWGGAGQKFDEVLLIDSTYVPAIKRNAFVYKNVNPHVAIEMLERIKRIEPENYEADKDLGDIAYKQEQYKTAVGHYDAYYSRVPKDTAIIDIRSCENYLMSLYSTTKFEKVAQLAAEMLPLAPNDMMFKRMRFFADIENYELDAAAEHMAYINDKEYADSLYLYLDYAYAAQYYNLNNDAATAIECYKKALEVDPTKAQGYKELSTLYGQNKQAELGLEAYKKYLELIGDKAELSDRFLLGVQYMKVYQEEGTDPERKQQFFQDADNIFAEVMEQKPDYVTAIIYRARLNNTDPTKINEEVKNLYVKVLEVTADRPDETMRERFEAARYLFFYAVNVEPNDMALAERAYEIAKTIAPDDKFVQNAGRFMEISKAEQQ